MKDLSKLPPFSVDSPTLAIACALWLKSNGVHMDPNCNPATGCINQPGPKSFSNDFNGVGIEHNEIISLHFTTFPDFLKWVNGPGVEWPDIVRNAIPEGIWLEPDREFVSWPELDALHAASLVYRKQHWIL